ncbi:sigma-54-dependent transcriptional regulator [Syntrophobacter fumaroxidans]|uniref:Two component, sigma54 specific, transcriptional regulator, Fis family n=1 Tax=Syntrophobacter fumaroxidans (strain DSM 10017 / MPOB) TaxID=335543 RepID=A0LMY2_SYNFM|nr:sigma-54 dependent transcriptional regulator [Syntrophobacter fumaroxidans]ABK18784.1 two component, sigma54 specific, transcriptional regulator, Fis family [Syntrophobacter fumaroxidans MPOB]
MQTKRTILVVDDDLHILEVIEARLSSMDFRVLKATSGQEALDLLKAGAVDLVITDVRMPGMGGMDLFHEIQTFHAGLPVIFLTAYGTISDAVKAVKAGAVDYLTKPFDGRDLVLKVKEILRKPVPHLPAQETISPKHEFWGGKSASMRELQDLVERIAPSDVNVLILGESGVGKERVARLIHQKGPRRLFPFVVVDCGSTPTGLLESELFGHVRGAFTHAIRDKKGLIEAAERGTLFLDEIGNISPEMQVRLLRFLEDRKIRRIGDLREIPVNCRVIAATNVDLPEDVEAGNFREDLYYRLRVVTLRIPPLRERREDIPLLAQHFLQSFCESQNLPPVRLPQETIRWLSEYPWPGNVRELKNALEAGAVLCRESVLRPSDLHLSGLPHAPLKPHVSVGDSLSLEESERNAIVRALQQAGWVQKDAAQLLGISRRAINYKIKKYGIESSGKRASAEETD